jgi:hypothetical protein
MGKVDVHESQMAECLSEFLSRCSRWDLFVEFELSQRRPRSIQTLLSRMCGTFTKLHKEISQATVVAMG